MKRKTPFFFHFSHLFCNFAADEDAVPHSGIFELLLDGWDSYLRVIVWIIIIFLSLLALVL